MPASPVRHEEPVMAHVAACPDRQELQHFLLGRLSGPPAEGLERHLDECPHCLELLRSLPADDPLLEAARSPVPRAEDPDDTAVHDLIGRLRGLRPETASVDTV